MRLRRWESSRFACCATLKLGRTARCPMDERRIQRRFARGRPIHASLAFLCYRGYRVPYESLMGCAVSCRQAAEKGSVPDVAPQGLQEHTSARYACLVHHVGVKVVLELQQVVRRVSQQERIVLLHHSLEARHRLLEEWDLPLARQMQQGVPLRAVSERDPEVAGIHGGVAVYLVGEVADELVTKEVERDAVAIAARQLTAQLRDIELVGRVQVLAGNGQMKHVGAIAHMPLRSAAM